MKYFANVKIKGVPENQVYSFDSQEERARFLEELKNYEPFADIVVSEGEMFEDISGGIL